MDDGFVAIVSPGSWYMELVVCVYLLGSMRGGRSVGYRMLLPQIAATEAILRCVVRIAPWFSIGKVFQANPGSSSVKDRPDCLAVPRPDLRRTGPGLSRRQQRPRLRNHDKDNSSAKSIAVGGFLCNTVVFSV